MFLHSTNSSPWYRLTNNIRVITEPVLAQYTSQCIDQSRSLLQMTWIDIISSYPDTYEAQIQTADEKKNERLYFL